MSEHIRSLFVIFGIVVPIFLFARNVLKNAIEPALLNRYFVIWIALTMLAFLTQNIWAFVGASILMLFLVQQSERNYLALYLFLLATLPNLTVQIPGFGFINYLIDLNYLRILSIGILLPAMLFLRNQSGIPKFGTFVTDKILLGYLGFLLIMVLRESSFTDLMRQGVYSFLDIFLPYYVASRSIKSLKDAREVASAFVLAGLFMSAMAMFEYVKSWLLYRGLGSALGVTQGGVGNYLRRGDSLRALVTSGQPIVLGFYLISIAGILIYLRHFIKSKITIYLIYFLLGGAFLATLSRGPWVGVIFMFLIFIFVGTRYKLKNIFKLGIVGALGFSIMMALPGGQKIIDLLPYIGKTSDGTITYREELFKNAGIVIARNPWFGSVNYLETPEMQRMMQGEQIVDIVNSYIGIALAYGYVGLALFISIFLSALLALLANLRNSSLESEANVFGVSVFSVLTAMLFTIATVSSIGIISHLCWIFAGLAVGSNQVLRQTILYKNKNIINNQIKVWPLHIIKV